MDLILFFYNRRLAKETSQQSDAQFLRSFHYEVRTLKTKKKWRSPRVYIESNYVYLVC